MATSLTGIGIVWATLSLAAALLCCTGFYLPFWIQGRLLGRVDAYFSSFRRCNYPRVNPQGVVEIVEECGRYSRFWDIPSPWWQASTVLVGTGSALSLLIAVTATAACCITYVIHSGNAKIAGSAQLLSELSFRRSPTGRRRCGGLSRRMGQQRSAGVLREHQPYIQTRYLPTFLVHLLALIRSTSTSHMFLFKFLRISGSCEIGVIISQNYNKDVLVYRNYSEPRLSGSKNEFLEGGEGRLVSDLSVQRRHVTEQRVALRLAHPVLPLSTLATTTTTTNCVEAERPGTSKTVIRAEIANVPLSPALGVANISDAVKSLPKCLMHSDGNVFD